jgi:hypothetical protein
MGKIAWSKTDGLESMSATSTHPKWKDGAKLDEITSSLLRFFLQKHQR